MVERGLPKGRVRGASFTESMLLVAVVALAGIGAFRKYSARVDDATTKQGERVVAMQGAGAGAASPMPSELKGSGATAGAAPATVPGSLKMPAGQSPILAQVGVPKGPGGIIGAGNPGEAIVEGVKMGASERANGASMGDSIGAGVLGGASTLATGVNAFEGLSIESQRRRYIAEGKFRGRYYDPTTGLVYTLRGDAVDINNKMQAPSGWLSPHGAILNWVTGAVDERAVYKPKAKPAPKP